MSSYPLGARIRQWLGSLSGRSARGTTRGTSSRARERGQVLPIFVVMAVVLLGGAALITDVAWWWTVEQRMQRAADAGALAGAVYLPGNETRAFAAAQAETAKNGYANGQNGIVVTPRRDPTNERKLIVDIDGDVETNFARVFSITDLPASVTGAAEFVLPVPMGSPENYYGVFGLLRTAGTTRRRTPASSRRPRPSAATGRTLRIATTPDNVHDRSTDQAQPNNNAVPGSAFPTSLSPPAVAHRCRRIEARDHLKTPMCRLRLGVHIEALLRGSSWTSTGYYDGLSSSDTTNLEGTPRLCIGGARRPPTDRVVPELGRLPGAAVRSGTPVSAAATVR